MTESPKRKRSSKSGPLKPSTPPAKKSSGAAYDPSVFDEFTQQLAATKDKRIALEAQRAAEHRRRRRGRLVGRLLSSLAHGTATMKVHDRGELVVCLRWLACRLHRLAAQWPLCEQLAGRPALIIYDITAGEPRGYFAGRTLLDLALSGAPVDEIERAARDALDRLRRLRDEGLMSALNDLPDAIAEYFEQMEHWYHKHDGDLYRWGVGPVTPTIYVRDSLNPLTNDEGSSASPVPPEGTEPSQEQVLEIAMDQRNLSEQQRVRVRRTYLALCADERERIPRSELGVNFGISPKTADKFSGRSSKRVKHGTVGYGEVSYSRDALLQYVRDKWSPRAQQKSPESPSRA